MLFGCPGSRARDVIPHGDTGEMGGRGNAEIQQPPQSTANFHIHREDYFLQGQALNSQRSTLRSAASRIASGTAGATVHARNQLTAIGGAVSRLTARFTRQGEPNRQPVGHQTNIAIQITVNPPNTSVDDNNQAPATNSQNAPQPDTFEELISLIMREQLPPPPSRPAEAHHGQNWEEGANGLGNNMVPQPDGIRFGFDPERIAAAVAARRQGPPEPFPGVIYSELNSTSTTPAVTPASYQASSSQGVSVRNQRFFPGTL